MRRRTLLERIGAVAAAGAVAGCLEDGAGLGAGGDDGSSDGESGDGTDGADGNETDGGGGNESDAGGDDGNETDDESSDGTDGDGNETHAESESDGGERHSLRTTERACGETDEATVEGEGETVSVTGNVRAPNPCHDAVLSRTESAVDGAELDIYVGVESTGGVCQQCLGTVAYEATVEFGARPGTVTVWHESGDTTREVASASAD